MNSTRQSEIMQKLTDELYKAEHLRNAQNVQKYQRAAPMVVSQPTPPSSVAANTSSSTGSIASSNKEYFAAPKFRTNSGPLVYGSRLEYRQGTSNKDYTITVTAVPVPNQDPKMSPSMKATANHYVVEAAYDRIGATNPRKQIKSVSGSNQSTPFRDTAIAYARNLEATKLAKGYVVTATATSEQESVFDFDSAEYDVDFEEFVVTNDPIIGETDPSLVPKEALDCDCSSLVEALAWSVWNEPVPATPDVAPYLTQDGYGLVRFEGLTHGKRWVVGISKDCSNGYQHARAVEVGGATQTFSKRKYMTALEVQVTLVEALSKDQKAKGADFVIVVEEKLQEGLLVIDAMRWDGQGLEGLGWSERRERMESSFHLVFPDTPQGRRVRLTDRLTNRLRETYLTESEQYRFELYANDGLLGQDAWILPN